MVMALLTTACSKDDDIEKVEPRKQETQTRVTTPTKTVLVYMAGKNSLSGDVALDLNEMKKGSMNLSSNDNLLVFVRRNYEKDPWLARVQNGMLTDVVKLSEMGITSSDGQNRSSDPVVMEGVLRYAFSHYPASDGHYGLVFWGHGSGWLMGPEVTPNQSRAFGVDYGNMGEDGLWINMPTIAKILRGMPHLKFIMGDCCNLMCLENLYEFRNVCDYIVGSPAEIPAEGAPYDKIVPDLFADGKFYAGIIDKYYQSVSGHLPLTAIQTCEMEHVAQATREAIQEAKTTIGEGYADMTGMIHYYHTNTDEKFHPEYNIFYDAGDFLKTYAPQNVYQQWKQVLGKAIVDYRKASIWSTDKPWAAKYSDFTATEEKMHGVSMFVPQDPAKGDYAKYNEDIMKFQWYQVVR